MNEIYAKFYNFLEIGDNYPTIVMGVLNLSPESFYQGSVYDNAKKLELAIKNMINNGAAILDLGARSTCLLYTSPSPRDGLLSRMPSSA